MSEAKQVTSDIVTTATDILKDNQDTIIEAIKAGQNFETTAHLGTERAFYKHMENVKYSLQDAVNIISAFGINSEISEMWEGVTPSDALILQAAETFRRAVWDRLESIYDDMLDSFDSRKDDMQIENAALSAFEVATKAAIMIMNTTYHQKKLIEL